MKASEVKVGAHLWWQRSKYGFGDRVVVTDANPVWIKGRFGSPAKQTVNASNTGNVLVNHLTLDGKRVIRHAVAVPLRQLLGTYAATKARLRAEEKAAEAAREARRKAEERADRYGERVVKRARKAGLTSAYNESFMKDTAVISLSARALEALLDSVPEGWSFSEDEEV